MRSPGCQLPEWTSSARHAALVAVVLGVNAALQAWSVQAKTPLEPTSAQSVLPATNVQPSTASILAKPIEIRVLRQDLQQVLQGFAEQAGVRVTLGKGLAKTVTDLRLSGTASQALDTLAEHIGAVWWWSGTDVRMVDRTDLVTKTLKSRDIDQTLSAARSLGIPVDLVSTQKADVPGIIRLTGPSGLVAELETLAQDVAEQDGKVHVTRYGRRRSTVR